MDLVKIFSQFKTGEEFVAYARFGRGHINSTFLVLTLQKGKYILQKINHNVFKDIDLLINNIYEVTHYLSKKNIETIEMIKSKSGKYYVEEKGEFYRLYKYNEQTMTFEKPEGLQSVANAAEAFGKFHLNISKLNAKKLGETIPHFHDTPKRYQDLQNAIKEDKCDRVKNVAREIEIVEKYKSNLSLIIDGIKSGEVKLHITHNDPKINNALFDENTHEFRAIIDLDTVMPGSVLYDFGDALRSFFTGENEDSENYQEVVGDLDIYKTYLKNYYKQTSSFLTPKEVELFPYAPFILTIECGMRFLEDYLRGDVYFHTTYEEHNLVRARTQLNLASSIMENIESYKAITTKIVENK